MHAETNVERAPSRLARMQQGVVLMALLALVISGWWGYQGQPARAVGLAFAVLTGHAWFLALEMGLAAWVNRSDPAPTASARQWLHAWWREVCIAPRVFAWRQPFRWRLLPDSTDATTRRAAPAVLIHGFVCNRGFWLPWMARLREAGMPYVSVNLEPVFGPIDDYVERVEQAVRRAERLGCGRPVLVCHSMGGLAARAWLCAAAENRARVGGVITIGSPHHGTWLAHFSRLHNGRQMRPRGTWLERMAQRERELGGDGAYSAFVCWYAHTDNIVFPASTATLPGADNRHVPGAAHVDLAFHPRVMDESLAMLASAGSSPSERTVS
ncbi:MAG: alpha/beta fold hydrolase [Hydrogenophaga sp.]|nr:alpha/beta fold hydrolase [Hydrogenophaga sp.]